MRIRILSGSTFDFESDFESVALSFALTASQYPRSGSEAGGSADGSPPNDCRLSRTSMRTTASLTGNRHISMKSMLLELLRRIEVTSLRLNSHIIFFAFVTPALLPC